jgi:hypothetical protein
VIGSGNSPQKHVWRARIVLLSAEGVGTMAIQQQTGKGKPTNWRWQARFMAEGVDGLLHEAARAGKPPIKSPQRNAFGRRGELWAFDDQLAPIWKIAMRIALGV